MCTTVPVTFHSKQLITYIHISVRTCAVYTGESTRWEGRGLLDEECRHYCCLYRAPPRYQGRRPGGLRFSRISWWWYWGVLRGCWTYTGESTGTRWEGAEGLYPTRWKMSSLLLPLQQGSWKYIRWHSGCFQISSNKNAESTGTAHGPNWLSDAKPSTPAGLPARGLDTPQGWELWVVKCILPVTCLTYSRLLCSYEFIIISFCGSGARSVGCVCFGASWIWIR